MSKPSKNKTGKPQKGNNAPKQSGGQPGNRNALRHGLRMGKLPKELAYVEIRVNDFRRILEDSLLETAGTVTQKDSGAIWAIAKRYREVMLRERRMRQIEEGCSEWFDHCEKSATAAEKLVKLLDRLPLDRDAKEDIVARLYSPARVIDANGDTNE